VRPPAAALAVLVPEGAPVVEEAVDFRGKGAVFDAQQRNERRLLIGRHHHRHRA
jgi:hypothetical protein